MNGGGKLASVIATAAALAGCGGDWQSALTPGTASSSSEASWIAPDARRKPNLLYVANASNVTVYDYANGNGITQAGTLTGFTSPMGMCTDKAGNVWIADYNTRTIYEYAHGGSAPIAQIDEKVGYPYACAVNRATGDIAVSNHHPNGHYRDYSEVTVYAPGSYKKGVAYEDKKGFQNTYFVAYDDVGNLYVTASPCTYSYCYLGGGALRLYQLSPGAAVFKPVRMGNVRPGLPSAIVWISPALLMGNGKTGPSGDAQAYKLLINGRRGQLINTVQFAGTLRTYGFTERAGSLIVPDYEGNIVRVYRLSDGSLVSSFTQGLASPFSAVVSQKK